MAGIVQAHLNVPYSQLLGQDLEEVSYSPDTGASTGTTRARSNKPQNFWHVPTAIKAILWGAQSKYPALTIAEPPLQYAQVKLGLNGSCLDYLCIGSCKNNQCTDKHFATVSVAAAEQQPLHRNWEPPTIPTIWHRCDTCWDAESKRDEALIY